MSPQSPVGVSYELYGPPEMILRFDFSLIIVSLGDPAVADFSKHYVEIHIASLTMFLGLLASTSLLDHTLLLSRLSQGVSRLGVFFRVSVEVFCSPCIIPRITYVSREIQLRDHAVPRRADELFRGYFFPGRGGQVEFTRAAAVRRHRREFGVRWALN